MTPLTHPLLTPRLRIEPVTPQLAEAARNGVEAFSRAIGADAPPDWGASSLGLVARSAIVGAPAPIRAVAVHRELGCVVGDVRFEPVERRPDDIEIGYSIAASRRRQGFAVEATGAIIDWLFTEGGVERAIAGCDRKNIASVRTLRKLGFWLDGSAANAFWWEITPKLRIAARA
jgi:RimJ/RimL family protein N-acetyltransferase